MLARLQSREADTAQVRTTRGHLNLGQSKLSEMSRDIEALRDLISIARGVLGIR